MLTNKTRNQNNKNKQKQYRQISDCYTYDCIVHSFKELWLTAWFISCGNTTRLPPSGHEPGEIITFLWPCPLLPNGSLPLPINQQEGWGWGVNWLTCMRVWGMAQTKLFTQGCNFFWTKWSGMAELDFFKTIGLMLFIKRWQDSQTQKALQLKKSYLGFITLSRLNCPSVY